MFAGAGVLQRGDGGQAEAAGLHRDAGHAVQRAGAFRPDHPARPADLPDGRLLPLCRRGQPWAGLYLEFDAITAVILGGTSLFGGRGRLLGTILGVLLYGIIINGLVLTGTNPYLQSLVKGLILLGVVLLDTLVQRRNAQ
ncbi:MAG: hypothetical protein EP318_18865 [Rhodobacteraceae bacterium]|nr:MAG: hypothetical protein EP318_18865 [Paracoccaceae bacterium]